MSKRKFALREINELKKNPNVKRVSELSIMYSDDFKRDLLINI